MAVVGSGEVKRKCRGKLLSALKLWQAGKVGCGCRREVVKCECGLPVAARWQGQSAVFAIEKQSLVCEQCRGVLWSALRPTRRAADTASPWGAGGGFGAG